MYRGKYLGTISNLNEYIAFRSAHGIDDKSYKDLYIGDWFTINDGTYNEPWLVAHFDYYVCKGESQASAMDKGVVLIPAHVCGSGKMQDTAITTGGYKASIAHTTTLPIMVNVLQNIFGSYMADIQALITTVTNDSVLSMAGAGYTGASTDWEWVSTKAILPTEVQIYGSTIWSSSAYDIGEACKKLAIFNFISEVHYGRSSYWLRGVMSSRAFTNCSFRGDAEATRSDNLYSFRPIIYIT